MTLREAKKCKIGDKVQVKKTGETDTIKELQFNLAGVGYPVECMTFRLDKVSGTYRHPQLKRYNNV